MIHYIELGPEGRITNAGSAGGFRDAAHFSEAMPAAIIMDTPVTDVFRSYWDGACVRAQGPRPADFHDFDYATKQWVANPEAAWASVKQQRARLLAGSDWMVTKAAESGQPVPPGWITYRQALRDITLQSDPWVIVWPVAP